MRIIWKLALLATLLVAAGCATQAPEVSRAASPDVLRAADQNEIAGLTRAIQALGPEVDPEEAARAARISIEYARQLAVEYNVTDPALIHNIKVNMGLRPRGLCYQWADDIEARLRQENFRTLILHRAIANADNMRIEHSTPIISRPGDTMFQGIVLDGWRYGGKLFWSPTLEDARYKWRPRAEVFAEKRRRRALKERRARDG